MEITQESWEALVQGQLRDARKIACLKKQVEKYAFMVEYLADTGLHIPDAEEAWLIEKEDRYERLGPYV